jgi:hypothetical protein
LKGIPSEKRADFWMVISGARKEKQGNPGYYEFLKNDYPKDIDLPHYHQIDLVILHFNAQGYRKVISEG